MRLQKSSIYIKQYLILLSLITCILFVSGAYAQPTGILTTEITVSETEVWQSDLQIGPQGKITITGHLTIENAAIRFSQGITSEEPLIEVKKGATLEFTQGSLLDLANLNRSTAFFFEEDTNLIIDSSEVSGANCDFSGSLFQIEGGTLQMINQAVFRNNKISGSSHYLVRINSGKLLIDNSTITGITVDNRSTYGALFYLTGSKIEISKANISGNLCPRLVSYNDSELSIGESSIKQNGRIFYGRNSTTTILDGNMFTENNGDCFLLYQGWGSISDNNSFTKNTTSPISMQEVNMTIGSALFSENSSNYGGGAISMMNGSLTLNGTQFIGNKSKYKGGAIDADGFSTKFTYLTINDAAFIENEAVFRGGAIHFGINRTYFGYEIMNGKSAYGEINKATFLRNKVTGTYYETAGGAIFVSENGTLRIKKLALINNYAEGLGGGIASAPRASVQIRERDNAIIGQNTVGKYPGEPGDLYIMDAETSNIFAERMYNGTPFNWQRGGDFSATLIEIDPEIDWRIDYYKQRYVDVNGYTMGTNISDPDISGASVIIQDSEVHINASNGDEESGKHLSPEFMGNGGGIGNNGLLVLGEDPKSLTIYKKWEDQNDRWGYRPSPAQFLEDLSTMRNNIEYDFGPYELISSDQDPAKDTWIFSSSKDPFITAAVEDLHNDEWNIVFSGLPQDLYIAEKSSGHYEASLSYDTPWEIRLINRVIEPTATPICTPTNTPSPTPTATETPTITMTSIPTLTITPTAAETPVKAPEFYLLEGLDLLPQTGF